MTAGPVICFGQQPCGIFPRRFLYAKIATARRLQRELGGRLVFFCHDSDHDPRETQTCLRHRQTGEPLTVNFAFENRLQRKYSPLYLQRVPAGAPSAARVWLARNPWAAGLNLRGDAVFVAPRRLPRHLAAAYRLDLD